MSLAPYQVTTEAGRMLRLWGAGGEVRGEGGQSPQSCRVMGLSPQGQQVRPGA